MSGSFVLSLNHDLSLQVFLPILGCQHSRKKHSSVETLNHCSLVLQTMIFEACVTAITPLHTLNVLLCTEANDSFFWSYITDIPLSKVKSRVVFPSEVIKLTVPCPLYVNNKCGPVLIFSFGTVGSAEASMSKQSKQSPDYSIHL